MVSPVVAADSLSIFSTVDTGILKCRATSLIPRPPFPQSHNLTLPPLKGEIGISTSKTSWQIGSSIGHICLFRPSYQNSARSAVRSHDRTSRWCRSAHARRAVSILPWVCWPSATTRLDGVCHCLRPIPPSLVRNLSGKSTFFGVFILRKSLKLNGASDRT